MALNLEKQLLFYGAYHNNPVCQCCDTHHMRADTPVHGNRSASNTPAFVNLPNALQIENLPPNLGTIAAVVYSTFYILLEPVAGALIAPLIIAGAAWANHLLATYGTSVNYWFAGIHVVSWLAQFVGHGAFERRAPALLDNLVQALLLAPLFVWMEVLFFFGYRPELKARYDENVEKEIAAFKAQKGKTAK
ncbi:uncharacterized protein An16g07420 [Aspergillus niger]|uniref:Contig An16c0230, genomic contig n=2 Tax=Aspergillus niger TaxID=5061 RepID=A2R8K0_ASPNC|nr:uncharacterized protein An16g07420 [Aspergillus niger]CAL00515.1 unnamed protein product [Aspergillus niger]